MEKHPFQDFPLLGMFYMLPQQLVEKSYLLDFPRNPWDVLESEHWRNVYQSDHFTLCLSDTWAWLTWPHFGIRGSLESYSGFDPFWRLAHAYNIWFDTLRQYGFFPLDELASLPKGKQFEYPPYEVVDAVAEFAVKAFWHEGGYPMEEIAETVRTHRDLKDYDKRASWVKEQHYQKFFRNRKSRSKKTPLPVRIPKETWEMEKVQRYATQHFVSTLGEKDRQICNLLGQKCTLEVIAKELGYANHSGVLKRVRRIREAAERFDPTLKPIAYKGESLPPAPTSPSEVSVVEKTRAYSKHQMDCLCKDTSDYKFNYQEGTFTATLVLKAWTNKSKLRTFWNFEDGRKVLAVIPFYLKELDMQDVPTGTRMELVFSAKENGNVYLTGAKPEE